MDLEFFHEHEKYLVIKKIYEFKDKVNFFLFSESYHQKISMITSSIDEKVKLYQTPSRYGLIKARVFGSRQATGQVRFTYTMI